MSKWSGSAKLIEPFRSANYVPDLYLIIALSDIFPNNGGIFNLSITGWGLIGSYFSPGVLFYDH